jgi:hypothetical protein
VPARVNTTLICWTTVSLYHEGPGCGRSKTVHSLFSLPCESSGDGLPCVPDAWLSTSKTVSCYRTQNQMADQTPCMRLPRISCRTGDESQKRFEQFVSDQKQCQTGGCKVPSRLNIRGMIFKSLLRLSAPAMHRTAADLRVFFRCFQCCRLLG